LRGGRILGLKFRRQHVLQGFVADFYCPALRLVLELDGAQHDTRPQVAYDSARTSWLAASGYRVMRIRNKDLTHGRLEALLKQALCETILRAAAPRSGEGDRG